MKGWGSQMSARITTLARKSMAMRLFRGASRGYTITEVMIFLAVTTGIFVMVASTFNQRQRNNQFYTAVREMESQVQDIANDISTGFYRTTEGFRCTTTGPPNDRVPRIINGAAQQGTSQDCILVGRVAHFVTGGSGDTYDIYSVAGARRVRPNFSDERDVTNYDEANPRAITAAGMVDARRVPEGLAIRGMRISGPGGQVVQGVGFFTTFGAGGSANPTALSVNLIPLRENPTIVSVIDRVTDTTPMNPAGGVVVCMDGEGTNQRAFLRIGTQNSRLTTETVMEGGTCAAAGF